MELADQSIPVWRKSSYSNQQGGECVEIASLAAVVGVRDSKDTDRGQLAVAATSWSSFVGALRQSS